MPRKVPAFPLYLVIQGSFWLFFAMMSTVSALYRLQTAGLNPLQLVLVGTVLELTVFVFEIPTGIVADVYSRRLSVIIGYLLIGLGFVLEGAIPLFATILLAQITWGLGATFTSGAEEAWLADEVGEERLSHIYLRGSQVGQAGTLIGIVVSVSLGQINLALPIVIGGLCIIGLALFLALFMPETAFQARPPGKVNTFSVLGQTFKEGVRVVRGKLVLMVLMGIALTYGLSSEGLDRLWEAHLLSNFTFPMVDTFSPVIWFGVINVVSIILTIITTEIIHRWVKVEHQATSMRLLLVLTVLLVNGLILFGLAPTFLVAIVSFWGVSVLRKSSMPLYSAWLNKGLNSSVRATVLSMRGQLDAIGQIIGGPIIGSIATLLGLRAAMIGVAIILAPAVLLYYKLSQFVIGEKNGSKGV